MQIIVVNRGVQPETIQIGFALKTSESLFAYVTSSSFGFDHWLVKYFSKNFGFKKIKNLLRRRTINIEEGLIIRKYFPLELIARLLPNTKFAYLLREIIDNRLKNFVMKKYIGDTDIDYILCQDSFGPIRKIDKSFSRKKLILNISTVSPYFYNKMLVEERTRATDWFQYYPKKKFSAKELMCFDRDIEIADLILIPSIFVKQSIFIEDSTSKIHVVPLGFDPKVIISTRSQARNLSGSFVSPLKIIYVGQVQQRKGIGYLVEAFKHANLPIGSKLTLIGMANKEITKKLKNYDFIELIGHISRNEISKYLDDSDLYVLPSLIEGFALSAIEAMSTGIPVAVSTSSLGTVIKDKLNGILFQPGNILELAETLRWCVNHKNSLEKIGWEGKSTAKEFTWEQYRIKIITIIDDMHRLNSWV